ncbi:MAG: bifunctional UDP-N-acetylmuramoyl-tripeptide:D-alanyl-D-alanine ligase/alanine racemase [Bacteroidales bacterium]|jgi:alanine racemase|nr:bifunctional UDP-N-acetylmuramoyl-tripeptide:D-alanyl-D-alanine ligase/alanine racemase [Bacteroidales bacterium]
MNFKHFNIAEIVQILKADTFPKTFENTEITTLCIDSRTVSAVDHAVFFALKSSKNDGHKYIQPLIEKGMKCFVVQQLPEFETPNDIVFIVVKNTLTALQVLAQNHRQKFNIPIIGITGSNGKTMVKEWLSILLEPFYSVVRNPKSYNSQIGVPLSVWEINNSHEIGIFEAGISEPGEMGNLQKIIQPSIGIFTNIGTAHDGNFVNLTQKIAEKLRLFTKVERLIYCADHIEIKDRLNSLESFRDIQLFTWSRKSQDVDLFIQSEESVDGQTHVTAVYKGETIQMTLPFQDYASLDNLMHCWACMLLLDIPNKAIADGMKSLSPLEMRLELKEGINHCSIINDSYSSDFNSLMIALDFLNQQKQNPKRTVILSDMLQSGRSELDLYQEIAHLLEQKHVDRLIGIGPAISAQAQQFSIEKEFYPDTSTFLKDFKFSALNHETILLKGSRVFAFEKINKYLQQKSHETVMEINLNAMQHNLNYYRSIIKPSTKIMSMVKAFSYGSGSFEISNFLQFNNVDYLTVAYADEGVELRNFGITLPIMVMNPEEIAIEKMLRFNLELEIYNFRTLNFVIQELDEMPDITEVYIHLKMDTGMHRLGFLEEDLPELMHLLQAQKRIKVRSIFSHLAAAEDPNANDFTQSQIAKFTTMSDYVMQNLNYPVLRHVLNSAGITRFPEAQFDMVRIGIGLYGVGFNDEEQQHLQNVSTFKSTISQIKTISANETVGYNRRFKAERPTVVGVIATGYADGLSRKLGHGKGAVMVNGQKAPIIGSVCMDMCMIDLTGIAAHEGDIVEIFGNQIPIQEVAKQCDTIPYEILTGISRRVKRVYYQE